MYEDDRDLNHEDEECPIERIEQMAKELADEIRRLGGLTPGQRLNLIHRVRRTLVAAMSGEQL